MPHSLSTSPPLTSTKDLAAKYIIAMKDPQIFRINMDSLEITSTRIKQQNECQHFVTSNGRLFTIVKNNPCGLFEYNFAKQTTEKRTGLEYHRSRYNTALIEVKSQMLSIGGLLNSNSNISGRNRRSPYCDAYNVEEDSWKILENLNENECCPLLCFYFDSKKILYAVSWRGNRTIQTIIVDSGYTHKWQTLVINYPDRFSSMNLLQSFITFDSEALFFGKMGKITKFNSDTNGFTREKTMKLARTAAFGKTNGCISISNGKLYALSNEGNLHMMRDGKWICIKGMINL